MPPAAAGQPGEVLGDDPLLRRHPRRGHRVEDVAGQRAEVDGDEAAHPQHPLAALAHPQHGRDGQAGQEVRGVDRGEEEVVQAGLALLRAGVAAPGVLQPLGRQCAAADPLVDPDRHRVVHRQAELVGEAAAVEVDDQADDRQPPVAQEVQVVARRRLDVPGDGADPQPQEHLHRVVGDAEQPGSTPAAGRRSRASRPCARTAACGRLAGASSSGESSRRADMQGSLGR